MVSSIAMSLNSLASKTSPHSWHSTNSASSSRATTRTRGCRQTFSMLFLSGDELVFGGFWLSFIFAPRHSQKEADWRIGGIVSLPNRLSSISCVPAGIPSFVSDRKLLTHRTHWVDTFSPRVQHVGL